MAETRAEKAMRVARATVVALAVGAFGCGGSSKEEPVKQAVVATPAFDVPAGTYDADQLVSLSTATPGAVVHYTTDGTTPSAASPTAGAPIAVAGHGTTVTIRAIATRAGMNDSAVASATYAIAYATLAAPAATPASGSLAANARVTFTSGTAGVTFRSTTDGITEPTCAGVGAEGANVQVAADLWVVACKAGMLPSPVLKLSYSVVTYNLMFATSTTYTGNLGGLAGGDTACAQRAAAAGLAGTYVAYLSTSGVDAISRLAGGRGWVRMDGRPFADTPADIAAGRILYPPRLDELGAEVVPSPSAISAMTGTLDNGMRDATSTCSDWTATSGFVRTGLTEGGTLWWSSGGSGGCADAKRLYCFGIDRTNAIATLAITGRLAFLSSSYFDPGSGLAAADAICATDAAARALAGTYKALLATDGASAASRFATTGATWVRTDGVQLVAAAADLPVEPMMAPLDVGPGGARPSPGQVWIGAADFGTPGTAATTCNGWSTSSGGSTGTGGVTGLSRHAGFFEPPCSNVARIYCLQD